MLSLERFKTWREGHVIDASTNLVRASEGAKSAIVHVTALTGALAGVFEGTMEDLQKPGVTQATAAWYPLPALILDTGAVADNLPGATITPDVNDVMGVSIVGSQYWRYRRTGNSGVANSALSDEFLSDIAAAAGAAASVDFGTKITAATLQTGGVGNLGFLSQISNEIETRIPDPATAWSAHHNPAVNVVATITKATPGAGFRLVVTKISWRATTSTTAPTAAERTVSLKDNAGSPVTHYAETAPFPASASTMNGVEKSCWIPLAENVAAVLAFASAGGANTYESVYMDGFVEAV